MAYVEERIGPRRAAYSYLWKSFVNQSIPLPLSSDFPVESPNPLLGLYAAVTRTTTLGTSPHGKNGWYASEKLTIEEALRGFTINAAYAANQESDLGSLDVGKWADFTVFDRDFIQEAKAGKPKSILDAKVVATIVKGNVVFGDIGNGEGGFVFVKRKGYISRYIPDSWQV